MKKLLLLIGLVVLLSNNVYSLSLYFPKGYEDGVFGLEKNDLKNFKKINGDSIKRILSNKETFGTVIYEDGEEFKFNEYFYSDERNYYFDIKLDIDSQNSKNIYTIVEDQSVEGSWQIVGDSICYDEEIDDCVSLYSYDGVFKPSYLWVLSDGEIYAITSKVKNTKELTYTDAKKKLRFKLKSIIDHYNEAYSFSQSIEDLKTKYFNDFWEWRNNVFYFVKSDLIDYPDFWIQWKSDESLGFTKSDGLEYCVEKKDLLTPPINNDCHLFIVNSEIVFNKKLNTDDTEVVKLETGKTTTKQTTQTVVVQNDTTGPEIFVKDTFTTDENLTVIIKGRVEDDSVIASLIIDGDQVSFTNGNFSQSLYVTEDREVIIAAIDKYGNRSNKIVLLKRGQVQPVAVTFDPLDPRKIKTKINNNAVALIIGVEEYENTFNAMFAKKDAQLFHDFTNKAFGVPFYNIKLLTNSGARRNDTLKTIATWLPKVIKENKTDLYLFFSGHGLASDNGKDLFLLPYDGDPEILEYSSLMRNQIFNSIANLNPRSVTVFLDTCYSGATRSNDALRATRDLVIVEEQTIPENFTVFSASANNEVANVLKEAEHGLFSYYLMKGLEGEADSNSDQRITTQELHAFINYHVSRQAKQSPQLSGDDNRVLVEW